MTKTLRTTKLAIEVEYDPDFANPSQIADAANSLLQNALSTDCVLDGVGNPRFGSLMLAHGGETVKLDDRDDLFIQVEHDPEYHGGDYPPEGQDGPGEFLLLSFQEINKAGTVEDAFEAKTGHGADTIVHYTLDQAYDEDGEEADD